MERFFHSLFSNVKKNTDLIGYRIPQFHMTYGTLFTFVLRTTPSFLGSATDASTILLFCPPLGLPARSSVITNIFIPLFCSELDSIHFLISLSTIGFRFLV